MYTFSSDGFFGYGEKGDFVPLSVWHILPIGVIVLCIVLAYLFREQLRDWKAERRFRFIYGFVMLLAEMSYFWRLLYVGDESGGHSLMVKLPLQVCQWGLICAVFMIMSESDTLFGINFFVTLSLTVVALFVPSVIKWTGPTYFRYYQFWLEHGMPIIAVAYMGFVHGKKPKYKHLWLTALLLGLLSVPCMIANHRIPNANFMYLGNYVEGSTTTIDPLSFFPRSQPVRYLCTAVIVIAAFHVIYFLWKGIIHILQKQRISGDLP
ncbi:MAG: TIGR02206 family membrane protein [Oscillospiraceae bacterium]|nr:TIGR02206 family membrane protein [Oscillospiraceae bacterium]